jgi:SAM-dependent methyltransferase
VSLFSLVSCFVCPVAYPSSVRFGEDSAQDMVEWAEEHFPQQDGRILDGSSFFASLPPSFSLPLTWPSSTVGTGNGQLLFAFSSAGYTSLTGVDYSTSSIELARSILSARLAASSSPSTDDNDDEPRFFVADVLDVALDKDVEGVTGEKWDLVTDKGTYDAVCLADETKDGRSLRELYIASVSKLLQKDGLFLITSCASF